MSEGFMSEIRLYPFDAIPEGWMPCNGQVLKITDNPALFALLGTTYGGDGSSTFALPDLRARIPIHEGEDRRVGARVRPVSASGNQPTEQQGFLALNFCICAQGNWPSRP